MKKLLATIILFLAVFGGRSDAATSDLYGVEFSKGNQTQVQRVIGYAFNNPRLLHSAFTHSSKGNREFEALEAKGDSLIRAAVVDARRPGLTAEAVHREIEAKNTNEHFATRYQKLGLDKLLNVDPAADKATVYANALEALVAAVAEDYYEKYPHLKGTGRVFRVISTVVKKLVLGEPTESITVKASKPVLIKPAKAPKPSAASSKIKMEVTIQKDGRTYTQTAKGKTESEARQSALNILLAQLKIVFEGSKNQKKKAKKFSAIEREHSMYGITSITTRRV